MAFVLSRIEPMTFSISADTSPYPTLAPERPEDSDAIEALLDHAFGPGRFVKSSERVREMAAFRPDLSFCAWAPDGRLVGSVRQWSIRIGAAPAIFLGPLAVEAEMRKYGVGGALVARGCEAAKAAGERAVLLVGDPPYFERFGFQATAPGSIVLPDPVDPRRVLIHPLAADAGTFAGAVVAP